LFWQVQAENPPTFGRRVGQLEVRGRQRQLPRACAIRFFQSQLGEAILLSKRLLLNSFGTAKGMACAQRVCLLSFSCERLMHLFFMRLWGY
jgi:hypothetical protein